MILQARGLGKKFNRRYVFKDLAFEASRGEILGIQGKNGSGKSTLLKLLAGYLEPSKGEILLDEENISQSNRLFSFSAPYQELIEEMTLMELLVFHSKFRVPDHSFEEMAGRSSLPLHKPIEVFSTGMKQRAQLVLTFFFQSDVILMDEPTSNLDTEGFDWWRSELEKIKASALTIIASNDRNELNLTDKMISLK